LSLRVATAPTATLAGFNDAGQVVFFGPGVDGTTMYLGSPGQTAQVLAANGTATPAGGTYAFGSWAMDARINALGDNFFHAPLAGGAADSALFLRRPRRSRGSTEGSFDVTDEYGVMKPHGSFIVSGSGAFSFVVDLQASRRESDMEGRLYVVRVTVHDVRGNATTSCISVIVPHDSRK